MNLRLRDCSGLWGLFLLLFSACGSAQEEAAPGAPSGERAAGLSPNGEIQVLREGEVARTLPAEFVPLDYPDMPWRGDPGIGASQGGTLYVALYRRIFYSSDGGRSWDFHPIPAEMIIDPSNRSSGPHVRNYDSFLVLRDGTLLWAYQGSDQTDHLIRSTDGGKTWEPWSRIEEMAPYDFVGGNQNCMLELQDGSLLWPTRVGPRQEYLEQRRKQVEEGGSWTGPPSWSTYVYRSQDGGRSWGDKSLLQEWGTETHVFQLSSGRLLAAIRYQRPQEAPAPANEPDYLRDADRETSRPNPPGFRPGKGNQSTVGKRVLLADSNDHGRTWTDFRPLWRKEGGPMDIAFGEAHGHLCQLSDGTVVLVHERRYPYERGDIRARISRDEGRTWLPEVYRLSAGHGYGASVVLADDTIVTAVGNSPLDEKGRNPSGKWSAGVVRWRLAE